MRSLFWLALLFVAALITSSALGFGPLVVNRVGEARIALFFSAPTVVTRPGIGLVPPLVPPFGKLMLINTRWQHLASDAREVATNDQERIVLDSYVIWRIKDPLLWNNSFGGRVEEAERQINQQVLGELRAVVGRHSLLQVLRDDRAGLLREITEKSGAAVAELGIELRDVRINRTELPPETQANLYARMRSERERLGKRYRAEGEEEARRLRAEADAEAAVLLGEARGQAEAVRGEGDAEAARLVAEAAAIDTEFYTYVRTLEAYRRTLGPHTTLVLPPDHPFLKVLQGGGEH